MFKEMHTGVSVQDVNYIYIYIFVVAFVVRAMNQQKYLNKSSGRTQCVHLNCEGL